MASEQKLRKLSREQIGTNLAGEAVPFSFQLQNGVDFRLAPLVYTPDLVAKVLQVLDQNDRYKMSNHINYSKEDIPFQWFFVITIIYSLNRLTWHNGTIPPEEIWVKIGGDKGGKSFKTSFQIFNVPRPNSVQNTCVFAVFEANNTPTNLHVALDRFKSQITSLQSTVWRYKCIVKMIIILFQNYLSITYKICSGRGDYAFSFSETMSLNATCTVLQVPQVLTVKFIL